MTHAHKLILRYIYTHTFTQIKIKEIFKKIYHVENNYEIKRTYLLTFIDLDWSSEIYFLDKNQRGQSIFLILNDIRHRLLYFSFTVL